MTAAASLRVVTINFFGLEPPVEERLALAARQLQALSADVVLMQEVSPLSPGGATTADRLAADLGMERVYARTWADGDDEDGHAILSRHPLADRRVCRLPDERPREARILLSARVETPVAQVFCHTTHLHWRLDDGRARERQVLAIDQAVQAARAASQGAVHVLGGDLNATPDADEIRFLRGLATLGGRRTFYQDAFAQRGSGPGYTWSLDNPYQGPHRRIDWNRRIDYLLVTPRDKEGRGRILEARVVLDEGSGAGAGRIACSDHFGVLAEVQIAPAAGN